MNIWWECMWERCTWQWGEEGNGFLTVPLMDLWPPILSAIHLYLCICILVFVFCAFLSLYLYLCICRNVCFWWTCGHQCSLLLIIRLCVQQPLISLISTSFLYVLFLLFLKDHTKVHSITGITCFQAVTYSVSQNPFLFPSCAAPEYLLRGNLIYPPDCTINNVFGSFLKISTLHSTSWSSKTRIKTLKSKMLRLKSFRSNLTNRQPRALLVDHLQPNCWLYCLIPLRWCVDPNIILQKKTKVKPQASEVL